ncbi:uncharacterized protein BT62DRAFT_1006811 [Guyanagaster necrorhizus]|uniref:G-protein coupled receptors family 2 profile 2 domain-containing protein n=1 Tax=Guyanagaster necrorhizus TaxID=856835 RepID=A0A9P7VTS3_9AGAR|nr:uncharacterized protein BT62DRAFT_1006811 [Guyanagaster necrorhizus MCA 3950]KAG7445781.1 hypothetical protein BT62DRAFT_1006811 [Guyanagaster necrorhizus MCA 3950]
MRGRDNQLTAVIDPPYEYDGFVFTDADNRISNLLWAVTSSLGAGLCFLVLLVIAVVMIHPVSRHQLDRVSFRIMIYALIANMVFGIASTVSGLQTYDSETCNVAMWLLMLTLELSTFLLFCIALNLQLVLVHGVRGQVMEKYYIIGSITAAVAITVPPFATKQYGWDPINDACWYTSDNIAVRLRWQVGTQIFWSLASVVGEFLTFFVVLGYMLRHQVLHGNAVRSRSHSTGTRSRAHSISTTTIRVPANHAKTYQTVIIRISLYPLASLIINTATVACDLYASTSHSTPTSQRAYNCSASADDFCYGGRAIVYAVLAATDPSLIRAIKSLWRHARGKTDNTSGSTSNGPKTTTSHGQITVHIELSEVRQLDDGSELPASPSMIKPASHSSASLPKDVEGGDLDHDSDPMTTRLDAMRRAQIGRAMEVRQDALDRRLERKDFKKQI